MCEVQSQKRVLIMSALVEASQLVQAIGSGVGTVGAQRRKAWFAVAKLSTDFTWNRICDLHRGRQESSVSGDELNVLRLAAAQQRQEANELAGRNELRELRELRDRVARLETLFRTVDPHFHRANLDGLRQGSNRIPDQSHSEDRSLA